MSYDEAMESLLTRKGIGKKVANCICLFGLHHVDAFPIDTHVKQLLDKYYSDGFDFERYKGVAGIIQRGVIEGMKVLLVKPQTYMNLSGESVAEVMNFYKLDPDEEMIVIFDDISLEPGRIRIRKKGSAGGHNGIKNIIAMTGTQSFSRIKVGVGEKPQGWDLADHVLGRFSSEDRAKVEEAIGHAMDAAVLMMQGETDKAMNIYN
ncbi:aminoacyl-tRNA hydrolase [Agathobacter rectalis]|uniref:aminoacyl-tRNA hydrolase n=1 Tax=Agathobacter rectalis TaxID=39491 RepID=UPI003F6B4049